jgi:hypothetical protein
MSEPEGQPFDHDPDQAYEQQWQGEEGDDPEPCRKAEGQGGDRCRDDDVDEEGAAGAGAGGEPPGAHR